MNRAVRMISSTLGVFIGIGGLDHGILETMHGNTPIDGFFIFALAPGTNWSVWKNGGEGAFTLIPNFLITGIVSIIVGLLIIVWSVGFINKKRGSTVFLLLSILLLFVGGGIGQIVFFILTWAISTRINKPLTLWQKFLHKNTRIAISKLWPGLLILFSLLFLTALEIAIFGYVPGVYDLELIQFTCWSILGLAIIIIFIAFVSGIAYDIEIRENG